MDNSQRNIGICGVAICVGFVGHLINVLILEPELGFVSPTDFYDFENIAGVLTSPVWALGALWHTLVAAALVGIAANNVAFAADLKPGPWRRFASGLALLAGMSFLLVAMINVAGFREIEMLRSFEPTDARSSYYGLISVRASLLSAGVFTLGAALLVPGIAAVRGRCRPRVLFLVQATAGIVCLTFVAVPAVAPVMMLILIGWGAWQGIVGLFFAR